MTQSPQDVIARDFMKRKGYPDVRPFDVEKLDGKPCWYYLYQLTEGVLELEVSYDERSGEWDTLVTTFTLAG